MGWQGLGGERKEGGNQEKVLRHCIIFSSRNSINIRGENH